MQINLDLLNYINYEVELGEVKDKNILLFKDGLSKNAIKRLKILKSSDDGFFIAEEDLKLRGFGDLIGYQQRVNILDLQIQLLIKILS